MIVTYEKSRVKNFSDAVFSIALTLLVLDIDVPFQSELRELGFKQIMLNRIAQFIGFFVSFLVIAMFWKGHVRNFAYAKFIDSKLMSLNIVLLLFIALLPFSTGFYVNNFGINGPFRFYCLNVAAIGFFSVVSLRYIYKSHVSEGTLKLDLYRNYLLLGINVTVIWIVACLISTVLPLISRYLFILIFVFDFLINRYYRKRALST